MSEEHAPDLPVRIEMNAPPKTREVAKRPVTKETIRALASAESFARGQSYLDDGAVSDLVQRGDRLTADVDGSEFEPTKSRSDCTTAALQTRIVPAPMIGADIVSILSPFC